MGIYNTQEVADELAYIEANIEPLTGGDTKRVLITGSTGGIGQLAAAYFLRQGHGVIAHARNEQRAADVRRDLPGAGRRSDRRSPRPRPDPGAG
ncbi:SDR family NAD(P)-dependent oxidoreductase [Hoyosella altamirensis]|uniref:NADPH:quinone reductase-like Zn-dependent oxidoreductase n=1 Tax=Hoyosella altamirensis TaxID=616997 RepID=A0A839RNL0_9ACTN|nr:SDR family NAD(P)-dependent oxidoreductase [Hoyosella altamirensis]MBB3038080.1 NADPH:quinone reductase-like Zn-dependent oxidoreductase [Hoyosella altamirensis]